MTDAPAQSTSTTTDTAALSAATAPADINTTTQGSLLSGASTSTTDSPPQEPVEKPEWLPAKYWRDGKADYESMAKSHAGLEQLLGKKAHAILVPNEKSTPEEVAAYRKAIGVPDNPDEYVKALKPEQMPAGVSFDEDMAKAASSIAHKHNVPPAALRELAALQMSQMQAVLQAGEQMAVAEVEAARSELKQQYGDKYGEKIDLASRVAKSAGVPLDSKGFSDPNMIKLALWAADKLSNDKIVGSETLSAATGRTAAKDIQMNPENPYYQRYKDGDPDVVDLVRRYIKEG